MLKYDFVIYNPKQANFLLNQGCVLKKIDIHKKTKKIMFFFKKDEKFLSLVSNI